MSATDASIWRVITAVAFCAILALLGVVVSNIHSVNQRDQMREDIYYELHDDIYQQVLDKVRFDIDELSVQVNENNEIIHLKVQMVERLADRAHAEAVKR